MLARLATAIPTGVAVTLSLLFAMHSLIAMQSTDVVEPRKRINMEFVRVIRDEEIIRDEFPPPELEEQPEQPPLPEYSDPSESFEFAPVGRKPTTPSGPDTTLTNIHMRDGPVMTIVLVQPNYPPGAAQRGIEGYVVVQFDVLANGTVGNISVLESSNSIFDRSAVQAAKKFRFKARVVDGEPLPTSGVQYKFRFEMDN